MIKTKFSVGDTVQRATPIMSDSDMELHKPIIQWWGGVEAGQNCLVVAVYPVVSGEFAHIQFAGYVGLFDDRNFEKVE